jgi:hypothetical protein
MGIAELGFGVGFGHAETRNFWIGEHGVGYELGGCRYVLAFE